MAEVPLHTHGLQGDKNIIQAFADIPRALFVDEGMKVKAYEDKALPIGMGQTISQVTTVAIHFFIFHQIIIQRQH